MTAASIAMLVAIMIVMASARLQCAWYASNDDGIDFERLHGNVKATDMVMRMAVDDSSTTTLSYDCIYDASQ